MAYENAKWNGKKAATRRKIEKERGRQREQGRKWEKDKQSRKYKLDVDNAHGH